MPLKILLADDSTTAQKLGVKFLEGAGHEVITVSNGAQALKKINSEKPQLAILDVVMPGYNGIEVCEKIRAVAETAGLPVIFTVGPMEKEAYKPADGERLQAEGMIVKPFQEKDLLAAVKKIEDKLAAASYESTQKLAPLEEIKDASYEEWKVSAPDEPAPTQAINVPDHMASSPAFGMDMLGDEPLTAPTQEIPAPDAGRITRALEMSRTAPPARDSEVEFTSPPREPSAGSFAAEGLEPGIAAAEMGGAAPGQDPALVTDAADMASAFPTKFGDYGEPVSVGVAADMPELYDDAAPVEASAAAELAPELAPELTSAPAAPTPAAGEPAAGEEDDFEARVSAAMSGYEAESPAAEVAAQPEAAPEPPPPGWMAEEEALTASEAKLSLEQEMQRTFAAVAVEEEPPAPEPVAEAAAPPENKPDAELAAAMSVAMGSEMAPAVTPSATPSGAPTVDANTIALIVHRVTERMKPQLIEEIARELAAEAERARK